MVHILLTCWRVSTPFCVRAGAASPCVQRSERELAMCFFHLADCLVPSVDLGQVGSIDPVADGNFEMAIPDFSVDPLVNSVTQPTTNALRVGTVLFVLRDKLGRTVAAVSPKESTPESSISPEHTGYICAKRLGPCTASVPIPLHR
jgi:hypothetical protein